MKILFLTNNKNTQPLIDWLIDSAKEEVIVWNEKLSKENIKELNPDLIISYNYRFLMKKEILDFFPKKALNLHISLLPYNRGSNPNIWSFLEDTPTGVTIHYVDEGIDTGDILAQREVFIDERKETLKSSYEKLQREIQTLFKENWEIIKNDTAKRIKQEGNGSIHNQKDYKLIEPLMKEKGWNISIKELKEKYKFLKNSFKEFPK